MFGLFEEKEPTKIEVVENDILSALETCNPEDSEYPTLISHLERINALRTKNGRGRVSPDTRALVIGNLLGILIIVMYEQKHVMTSKGLGFILKNH